MRQLSAECLWLKFCNSGLNLGKKKKLVRKKNLQYEKCGCGLSLDYNARPDFHYWLI